MTENRLRTCPAKMDVFVFFFLALVGLSLSGPTMAVVAGNKPNILVLLIDDVGTRYHELERAMPKTLKTFGSRGSNFTNAFVSTPLCCPSRASILSGQYVHNHGTRSNNDCYSNTWRKKVEPHTVGPLMQRAGYRTRKYGTRTRTQVLYCICICLE